MPFYIGLFALQSMRVCVWGGGGMGSMIGKGEMRVWG